MPFSIIAFGVILIAAGAYHFVNPAFYNPMMPRWFPKELANAAGGIVEIIIGIGLLVPDWRTYALYAACGLMVVFLPLHIWDLMKPKPAVGPHWAAAVRLLIQVLLIWWIWRQASAGTSS
ncbi:MAG: hypothetical protein OTI34_02665 [Lewinella sp.]|jgi:uncharacterized membrane protein|nr:hypothetical protein [Lewinella sp.]